MIEFLYNGKPYKTPDLEKKLKKMGITESDIEIINNNKNKDEIDNSIKKYYFINPETKETIVSIYDKCPERYVKCNT